MATHSNIFSWKIPWREEPGRVQSMVSERVGHNLATEYAHVHIHTQLDFQLSAPAWLNRKLQLLSGVDLEETSSCRGSLALNCLLLWQADSLSLGTWEA